MRADQTRKSAAQARVGTMFVNKWRLERLLGSGGMGAVYEARHRNGALVALKILHPELADKDVERERFRREAFIANRVEHPAVVHVLDDDEDAPEPFLVMELVAGWSLDQLAGQVGEAEVVDVAGQVLEALVVAHARGVIHRDIKPHNLLLDRDHRIRILDFGIARVIGDPMLDSLSEAGSVLGTIEFAAPEQVAGAGASESSDLYSLGATLFTLVSGEYLPAGSNAMQRLVSMTRPSRSLGTVEREVDERIVALVDRATMRHASERWSSAEQMLREARRLRSAIAPPRWDLGRGARAEEPTRRIRMPNGSPLRVAIVDAAANLTQRQR